MPNNSVISPLLLNLLTFTLSKYLQILAGLQQNSNLQCHLWFWGSSLFHSLSCEPHCFEFLQLPLICDLGLLLTG